MLSDTVLDVEGLSLGMHLQCPTFFSGLYALKIWNHVSPALQLGSSMFLPVPWSAQVWEATELACSRACRLLSLWQTLAKSPTHPLKASAGDLVLRTAIPFCPCKAQRLRQRQDRLSMLLDLS